MPNRTPSIFLAGAAAGVAAVIAGLIPTLGDCLACIILIASGVVAVWHYTDRHQLTIKGGQGLVLGGLAGLVAAAVQTVLDRLFVMIGLKPSWQEEVRVGLDQSGMDPAQMEQIQQMLQSPGALIGIIAVGFVVTAIGGGIGGLIGASLFKREQTLFDEPGDEIEP